MSESKILTSEEVGEIEKHYEISIDSKFAADSIPALCATVRHLTELLNDATETESHCRELLKEWDKSSPDGVVPLDEVIQTTLIYVNKSLAEPYAALIEHQRQLLSENERLKCGDFTSEEFQNLCHNTDVQAGFDAFADGCEAYQQKMFGRCRTKGKVL